VFGPKNRPRLLKVYRHAIDIEPAQHMVFLRYDDIPGMIGRIGTIIGGHGINIAFMNVGRKKVEGKAIMGLALDEKLPADVFEEVQRVAGVDGVRQVELSTMA
jgi:D-3-phosphoglycerate dehydrogenase